MASPTLFRRPVQPVSGGRQTGTENTSQPTAKTTPPPQPGSLPGPDTRQQLPPRPDTVVRPLGARLTYRSAARRFTAAIVSAPLVLVLGYMLIERASGAQERRKLDAEITKGPQQPLGNSRNSQH